MLVIAGDLPPEITQTSLGAEATSSIFEGGGVASTYQLASGNTLEASVVVTVPSIDPGDPLTVTVPAGLDTISSVVVGGVAIGFPSFQFDQANNTVTIDLPSGVSMPSTGSTIVFYGLSSTLATYETNEYTEDFPDWLSTWNPEGEMTVTRSFGDQPSAALEFTTLASNENSIRAALDVGTVLNFGAIGVGLSVSGMQITRLPKLAYPAGLIKVSVSFTGAHVKGLSKKVKLKQVVSPQPGGSGSGAGGTGAGTGGSIGGGKCDPQLSDLAQSSGVGYSGPAIGMNQSTNTPEEAYTTLQDEMETRAVINKGYVFYSAPGGVSIRTWPSRPDKTISTAQILGPVEVSIDGDPNGAEITDNRGITNRTTNNISVQWTPDTDNEAATRKRAIEYWLEEADLFYDSAPPTLTSEALRTPAANFINGGPTKQRIRTLYKNGSIQKQIRWVYGLVYKSPQVYERVVRLSGGGTTIYEWRFNEGVSPGSFWRLVEESTETYSYDMGDGFSSGTGYLTKIEKKGRKIAQYKQEQNNEALAAELAATVTVNGVVIFDADKLRALYNFTWLPYIDTTEYELTSYIGTYPDIEVSTSSDWVEPKFASRTTRESWQQIFVDNPEGDTANNTIAPPTVAGKLSRETQVVSITYPNDGLLRKEYNSEFDQYVITSYNQNSEGANLQNSLRIGTRKENSGRPPIHTAMQIIKPDPCAPKPGTTQDAFNDNSYFFSTTGSANQSVLGADGSVSYDGIVNVSEAASIAQAQSSIDNTFSVEIWRFAVPLHVAKTIAEGDGLNVGNAYLIVRSVQFSFQFIGLGQMTAVAQIEAGIYLNPPITITTKSSGGGAVEALTS